jgi:hypothetical protein
MTMTTAHGRTRTLDLDGAGINGSGHKVWIVWTSNTDGTLHHMEKFTSRDEAVAWMRWA